MLGYNNNFDSLYYLWGWLIGISTLWSIAAWVACGVFSSYVAQTKGYSSGWWLLWGLLFGPVALLATVGLANKVQTVRNTDQSTDEPASAPAPRRYQAEPVFSIHDGQ